MNPLCTLGEDFRFHHSSRFRKKAGDAKFPSHHSFVSVLMSLVAESCRYTCWNPIDSGYFDTIGRSLQAGGHPESHWNKVWICFQVPTKVRSALLIVAGAKEGGVQKQTTHQKIKTKLSSATPNRDKTIHCQRKRRKKHTASNVAGESAPHPRHAAKVCDNNSPCFQSLQSRCNWYQAWHSGVADRLPVLGDLVK